MRTKTFVNDRVHVRRVQCKTCIFGTRSPVSAERRDGMIAEADKENSCIPCHSHLYEGAAIEPCCAGYFARKSSFVLRLAEMMGIVKYV
jgi:hypothetical protein